jgi:hypothetical protein
VRRKRLHDLLEHGGHRLEARAGAEGGVHRARAVEQDEQIGELRIEIQVLLERTAERVHHGTVGDVPQGVLPDTGVRTVVHVGTSDAGRHEERQQGHLGEHERIVPGSGAVFRLLPAGEKPGTPTRLP